MRAIFVLEYKFSQDKCKYLGFLTLLYAGTTWLQNSRYSLKNSRWAVKKLESTSQSAGNILQNGSSETMCNEIVERVKLISNHVPKHYKPINDEQFGHYIAGLIDGDGHFSSARQLVIVFSNPDAFLAYYLKTRIGYGTVNIEKSKKTVCFTVTKREGLEKILNLINGKLRTQSKYDAVYDNILNVSSFNSLKSKIDFKLNNSNCLNNHWLAGFSDVSASFQIINLKPKMEIRLAFLINNKNKELIILIKNFLGGNISYNKIKDSYTYNSSSYGSAKNVIEYFDRYPLLSRKHVNFLRWRKSYILIQNKEHLTEKGINKIIKIKTLINRYDDTTI